MKKIDIVETILQHVNRSNFVKRDGGYAFAPTNIALCKYWGKRDLALNLPFNSSLSISLASKGAFTKISHLTHSFDDRFVVNDEVISLQSTFAIRLKNYLDLYRPNQDVRYLVETYSTVPISAGFASSASGFAALILALNNLYDWCLAKKELSILARLGSGSASRSLWQGFVTWQMGKELNGMDSYGEPIETSWSDLRIGSLLISSDKKTISSTDAMKICVETSPLYSNWIKQAEQDFNDLKRAILAKDFYLLGETSERNSEAMHNVMISANPQIIYSSNKTQIYKDKVKALRQSKVPVFFTQDAGANLHLLFLRENEAELIDHFNDIDIVSPFADSTDEQVVLVDKNDVKIGIAEKIAAHKQAKLHRAFSVFILRKREDKIEVLLQQRHKDKYHSGGLWSNATCGHPRPFENIEEAAKRRLKEEMGIAVDNLIFAGKFQYEAKFADIGMIENEIDYVYVGFIAEERFIVNPVEVVDYAWILLSDLKTDLAKNSRKYTLWFEKALDFAQLKI